MVQWAALAWCFLFPLCVGARQIFSLPSFTASSIVPAGSDRPELLVPGMLVSIYGHNLSGSGPQKSCVGQEPYPLELCETRVTVAGIVAPLLYVSDTQINFKVPDGAPREGQAEIRVVQKESSHGAVVRFGKQRAVLSLDGPAFVGMPIWLRLDVVFYRRAWIRYPFSFVPWDFLGRDLEVRFNGQALPRIPLHIQPGSLQPPFLGLLGLPREPRKTGRLPLHLEYKIDKPGTYEVRYTEYREMPGRSREMVDQSEWTSIEIRSSTPEQRAAWLNAQLKAVPDDAVDLLSEFLPDILASSDPRVRALLERLLYHRNQLVRNFALQGLAYFGEKLIEDRMPGLVARNGPVDVIAYFLSSRRQVFQPRAAQLVKAIMPHLASSSPLIAAGAVQSLRFLKSYDWSEQQAILAQMDRAVLNATPSLLRLGDDEVVRDLAVYLGTTKSPQARDILWRMVNEHVATEQAAICLTWIAQPDDLQRLAELAKTSDGREAIMLPYHLRRGYGERAIPYLEEILAHSRQVQVRTDAARELVLAGRAPGFAYALDAIEQNRQYKNELLQFVRDQFPQLRSKNEGDVIDFLKSRLAAK